VVQTLAWLASRQSAFHPVRLLRFFLYPLLSCVLFVSCFFLCRRLICVGPQSVAFKVAQFKDHLFSALIFFFSSAYRCQTENSRFRSTAWQLFQLSRSTSVLTLQPGCLSGLVRDSLFPSALVHNGGWHFVDELSHGSWIASFVCEGRKRLMRRVLACSLLVTVAEICSSCGGAVKHTQTVPPAQIVVAKVATRDELLEKYNAIANGVKSLDATVQLKPTAGSQYSGVIEEYHEVKAFLLAERSAYIRMIGQAPVIGKTIFDMTSDGTTFHVWIPSKNKFLVGPVALERTSSKPIENLRPQHLLDALLWTGVRKEESVLFEEFNGERARYYVLTVLRGGYQTEILRKIWFDRADLQIVRLEDFGPRGILLSDVRYSDWEPLAADEQPSAGATTGVASFPRVIQIDRPHDDYRLDLQVAKLMLNQNLSADRFRLEQPAGSELVNVGDDAPGKQP